MAQIYVTLIMPALGTSKGQYIKFIHSIYTISVREILKQFGITNIEPPNKIWIKRKNSIGFRSAPYAQNSQLSWEEFHESIIVIYPEYPQNTVTQTTTMKPAGNGNVGYPQRKKNLSVVMAAVKRKMKKRFILYLISQTPNFSKKIEKENPE